MGILSALQLPPLPPGRRAAQAPEPGREPPEAGKTASTGTEAQLARLAQAIHTISLRIARAFDKHTHLPSSPPLVPLPPAHLTGATARELAAALRSYLDTANGVLTSHRHMLFNAGVPSEPSAAGPGVRAVRGDEDSVAALAQGFKREAAAIEAFLKGHVHVGQAVAARSGVALDQNVQADLARTSAAVSSLTGAGFLADPELRDGLSIEAGELRGFRIRAAAKARTMPADAASKNTLIIDESADAETRQASERLAWEQQRVSRAVEKSAARLPLPDDAGAGTPASGTALPDEPAVPTAGGEVSEPLRRSGWLNVVRRSKIKNGVAAPLLQALGDYESVAGKRDVRRQLEALQHLQNLAYRMSEAEDVPAQALAYVAGIEREARQTIADLREQARLAKAVSRRRP